MGLITKSVKIHPRGKMISYYRNKGYEFNYGDEVEIRIEDLSETSRAKIECNCDYCNKIICIEYSCYCRSLHSPTHKIACLDCTPQKRKESNLIIYGVESVMKLPEFKEKIKNTMLEKYGVTNSVFYEPFFEKQKETCIKKYGFDNPLKSKEIKDKVKRTMNERYGASSPLQVPEFLQKAQETIFNNYGVFSYFQTEECAERSKQICLEKYGVPFPSQSKEIREKIIQTNIKKFGYSNPNKSPTVRKKTANTLYKNQTIATSTQQKYLHHLFNGELNGVVSHYNCDIVFREEKIAIEYDGGGHFLSLEIGNKTQEEFIHKEMIRNIQIKREGFRIMRIISRKDYLPSDEVLLSMLQFTRQFFIDNPDRSWISFDIDNNCIYNAYHKESTSGLPYDYGKLRKIKKEHLSSSHSSPIPQTLSQPSAQ